MEFIDYITNIEEIELELTGTCNLSCPLCARNNPEAKQLLIKNHREIHEIINHIESFKNLKRICLAGIISEPTLYKDFFKLIEYIGKRQNELSVELYTNASLHNIEWWENLGKIFPSNIKIYFTICGSTQELHEKYRKGSDLNKVINNAKAFLNTYKYKNDYIQHIKFVYNLEDFNSGKMEPIFNLFNNRFLINSLPYNERFNLAPKDFNMPEVSKYYTILKKQSLAKFENSSQNIICKAKKTKFISIDQFGNETPCFLYRMYKGTEFTEKDFKDIDEGKNKFCYECDKFCETMMSKANLEQMA